MKPSEHLNHTQIQILVYLIKHKNEEVCQKDLQNETHLKKASITGALDSLEDKAVTIRDRDTMEQVRLPIAEVRAYLEKDLEE